MSTKFQPPPAEVIAEIRAFAERQLSPEEFEASVSAPMSDDEREGILSLHDWLVRRYPTALERLAFARRHRKQRRARGQ